MKPNWVAGADKPQGSPIGLGRVGRLTLSPEFVAQAFGLPEGTRILDVSFPRSNGGKDIKVLVAHPDLLEVESEIPDLSPEITTDAKGAVTAFDWGQK